MTEPEIVPCVICRRRFPRDGYVCEGDRTWLHTAMVEIPKLYGRLPASLAAGGNAAEKVSGSREAPLPLRVDVLDLMLPSDLDPLVPDVRGTVYIDDQAGRVSVATVLDGWVRDWCEVRESGEGLPVPTVAVLAGWLDVRLDWACDDHPAIDEFAKEIRDLLAAMRAAVGESGDKMVLGPCPAMGDRGPCGATLSGSPWLDVVECPRCRTRWDRRQWLVLGAAIQQAKAEAA